jgi:4-hydroxy-tetrahydrodipicolinate reductase
MSSADINVVVAGAAGRMGREVVRAVAQAGDMKLVAAVDRTSMGCDAGEIAGVGSAGIPIDQDIERALGATKANVLVDFTIPSSALGNVEVALRARVAAVVGTSGLTPDDLSQIRAWTHEFKTPCLVAPNFAIGAVLMMEFAAQAAKYMPDCEIIELHHEKKLDSPSGTALMTAHKIAAARKSSPIAAPTGTIAKVPGGRGAISGETHIHSVRLPGHVAHQEVIFGGLGQTLTIRHDSIDRASFMPGVLLAIRKVKEVEGLVVGLENLLD